MSDNLIKNSRAEDAAEEEHAHIEAKT